MKGEASKEAGTTSSAALALGLVRRARLGPGPRCSPPRGLAERPGPLRPLTAVPGGGRAAARALLHVRLR